MNEHTAHPNGSTPLMDAAAAIKRPYQVTQRLVLIGELKGWRKGRHWFVDTADIERYVRENTQATGEPTA
jgi:hypothetical protein